jgi:ribose 5-phosphate isomerase RpiB
MYYGGYATIDKYNKDTNQVFLKIPNKSISADLARNYLKSMLETKFKQVDIVHMKVREFERVAREVHDVMTLTPINEMGSKIEEIIKSFENVLNHYTHDGEAISSEREFRNIIDSMLKLKFHNVAHEVETNNDRIDTVIIEKSRIFILQYKYKEKASTALKQIKEKEYYAQYLNTNLPILLFGISLREKKDKSKTRYIDISNDIKKQ